MLNRRLTRIQVIIAGVVILALLVALLPQYQPHRRQLQQQLQNFVYKNDGPPAPGTHGEDNFDEFKWGFQLDMPWYHLPEFSEMQQSAAAHNWRGPGHETFATFFASRNASMSDSYFLAAQQIVYRVLWDPKSRTRSHTMTVFVAPFISAEHRAVFRAAGALVRELPLRPFVPGAVGTAGRLRDMFSKLEMWNQVEFSRIAYLDSDAFPLQNIDSIFELSEQGDCKQELLPAEDKAHADEICPYTFAGFNDFNGINAGVIVFNPNKYMYERLIRESIDTSKFDNGLMEQAMLNVAYDPAGPFPPTSHLPHAYNGGVDTIDRGEPLYVVHAKIWATIMDPDDAWHKNVFNETWISMLEYYQSEEFKKARIDDGLGTGS